MALLARQVALGIAYTALAVLLLAALGAIGRMDYEDRMIALSGGATATNAQTQVQEGQ